MEKADKKKTIIIVDDDSLMLDMYSVKFKERGFNVDPHTNPKQVLEKLREGSSAAVILFDMVMPGLDGLEFLDILRSEKLAKDTILVAISNQWEESYIEKAKELGVDDYIIKADVIPSDLVSKIEKIIKKHNKN